MFARSLFWQNIIVLVAYLRSDTYGSVLSGSESSIGLSEISKVLLPTLEQGSAKAGVDNLVKGSEGSDIRQTPDEHLKRTLAKLKLKAVQTLEQFPAGISL